MRMSTQPPKSSAPERYLAPNTLPILTPAAEKRKVIKPIKATAGQMFTRRKAKVTPTARASMLVARASGSMAAGEKEPS